MAGRLCTRKGGYSQSSKSGRVDLWLPGYKCQHLLWNSSSFAQELHIVPSQLDAGGSRPKHRDGSGRAGAYVPTDLGLPWGHQAGGAAAHSHFLILARVLLVTFRSRAFCSSPPCSSTGQMDLVLPATHS